MRVVSFSLSQERPLSVRFAAALAALIAGGAALAQEAPPPRVAPAVLAHDIQVTLDPATGGIEATDTMTVKRNGCGDLLLDLRADLGIRRLEVDRHVVDALAREETQPRPGTSRYRVRIPDTPGDATVVLAYGGTIREEVRKAKDLAFVAGDVSHGTISPEGVFLGEGTGWVPLDGSMATFTVTATVPEGWSVATQGGVPTSETLQGRVSFQFPAWNRSDGLWLQAGRWKVERRLTRDKISLGTYLSEANAGLSKTLLDAAEEYLGLYEKALGPYPHLKFDIVENFFTTGYGMPSATLLGGDVIAHMGMMAQRSGGKIPAGYLDHELVHCWWGNGVFVDYDSGNWCEALTTYCSNYLRKEWESAEEGAKHRRGTRSRFAARVDPAKDYPLRRFTGKTEDFENDIGYGKGSMLFHQVRRAVGDAEFFGALREFAKAFVGKRASWEDLRAAFEKRSRRNLETLFAQFLDRKGAPVVVLANCAAAAAGDGFVVTGDVLQTTDPPWTLSLPLVVETARGRETTNVDVTGTAAHFSLKTKDVPTCVLLDPDSQCWRGYADGEAPACLDATLCGSKVLYCWAPPFDPARASYAPILDALNDRLGPGTQTEAKALVIYHAGKESLRPEEPGSVLSLGTSTDLFGPGGEEKYAADGRPLLKALSSIRYDTKSITVNGQRFQGDDIAVLASARAAPGSDVSCTAYLGLSPAALSAARRVFFYGGDGVVVFKAGRPVLRLEPEGDESSRATLLASEFTEPAADRAKTLVASLCAKEVEGRLAGTIEGAKAWKSLAKTLTEDGLSIRVQEFSFEVADWDGTSCFGVDGQPVAEAAGIPFCFSPAVAGWKSPVTPLLVDAATTPDGLLSNLQRALEGGAAAVLVIGPPEIPKALADYLLHPSALPESERAKLKGQPADLVVEGRRSRLLLPDFEVKVPVVYFGKEPETGWLPMQIRSPVTQRTVDTANLFAVIPGADPALAGEAVLLGAHHDHLGPGFPGANDDASGVAAVREAARALLAVKGSLRRPVAIALFGAEEWGLRGSRHFVMHPPEGFPKIVAGLTLDAVGQGGVELNVVGESVYPALGALVSRCLAGAGLPRGRDIDRFAFAWGSDHYSLHAAGIPAVDLFGMDYATMHSPADTPDIVDGERLARLARAAAAFALSVSRDGAPR